MSSDCTFDGTITVTDPKAALAAFNQTEKHYPSLAAVFDAALGSGDDPSEYGIEQANLNAEHTYALYGSTRVRDDSIKAMLTIMARWATGEVRFREDHTNSTWRYVLADGALHEETGRVRFQGDDPQVTSGSASEYDDLVADNATAQTVEAGDGTEIEFSIATFVTVPAHVAENGAGSVGAWLAYTLKSGSPDIEHRIRVVSQA